MLIASLLLVVALGWMVGPTMLAAADDTGVITGIVTSTNGPEAGVWVIAETDDLETMFRKIVVTNDEGRFLIPELPDVTYRVWLRGYGLVDSTPTAGTPGQNVPIANGSNSDSLLALDPDTGEWVVLRVPYPQGFHSRGLDGRIDDPNGGWKGRGVYATYGADAAWHVEGGPDETGNLVRFQIRPDPLAN